MAMSTAGPDIPSTLGGNGWRPRASSHADEVSGGRIWSRCGYRCEVDRLRAVLLAWPPDSLGNLSSPRDQLMAERVDPLAMRAQAGAVADAFHRNGVEVHLARPAWGAPPNVIFMRDLFFMTPEGAIVARTASAQRAGEERHAAEALASAGFPILCTVSGLATFEGADALWLADSVVMVAVGFRTNRAGAAIVRGVLSDQRISTIAVELGPGVQHLLGAVMFLDRSLAAVHPRGATGRLRGLLREHGVRLIDLAPDDELEKGKAMNLVALAPRRVLMPAGNPRMRGRLEAEGVSVEEVDVGEYAKAAGGLGCLTGILRRDPAV
jgi:N-dimethylarginine dimethylaminohydrolase